MNCLKAIVDLFSVNPKTAAKWAGVNLPTFFDAYASDDQDEIMTVWELKNIFSLAQHLKILPTRLLTDSPCENNDPSVLFTLFTNIEILLKDVDAKNAFENFYGWTIDDRFNTGMFIAFICVWRPRQLIDLCEHFQIEWLGCLDGLYIKWINISK